MVLSGSTVALYVSAGLILQTVPEAMLSARRRCWVVTISGPALYALPTGRATCIPRRPATPSTVDLYKNKVVFIYVKNQSNDQATHITNTQNEKIKRLQIIFQILALLGEVELRHCTTMLFHKTFLYRYFYIILFD